MLTPGANWREVADEVHTVVGRKGLLFKEPATKLALRVVHEALGLPPGKPKEPIEGAADTAVVVSSNFGNVETVADLVREIRAGSGKDVSPLRAPNASSNIIASTIAIRYGFTGPNVMICNGPNSAAQAHRIGALLLKSGRAKRVVVVDVEPADEITTALHPGIEAHASCVVLTLDSLVPEAHSRTVLTADPLAVSQADPLAVSEAHS
jgi:3-oxoacyl-[acyl-carrier-protein] synthase II